MYEDAGVDLTARRVGIGSICRRGHLPEIVEVIEQFADAGYAMHGFGLKTTALPIIGHLLRSADSMAWSFGARRDRTRLDGCEHRGDCRNCYRYAVHWRAKVLAAMQAAGHSDPATLFTPPHRVTAHRPRPRRTPPAPVPDTAGWATVLEQLQLF